MPRSPYRKRSRPYRRSRRSQPVLEVVPFIFLLSVGAGLLWLSQSFGLDWRSGMFVLFLLLISALIAVMGIGFFVLRRHHQRYRALEISQIDQLTGVEFEHYLRELLVFHGFTNVSVTVASGDFGADLLAEHEGIRYAIQAKKYAPHNLVGVEAIYQILGGRDYYSCQASMVITTSFYTPAARELAEKTGTELIDRNQLIDWIVAYLKK